MASNVQTTTITIGGSVSRSLQDALSFSNDGLKRLGDEADKLERKLNVMGRSSNQFARMRAEADALRASQEALQRIEDTRTANLEKREKLGSAFGDARGMLGSAITTLAKPVENAAGFARENQAIGNAANLTRAQVAALGQTILAESSRTPQGAGELQRAVSQLVAAGLDAQTAQSSLGAIGRTTTATGESIDDVTLAASGLQQALMIDPSGLQSALDVLVVAGKDGGVGLKDMAGALPVLGSAFQSLQMHGNAAAATMGAALDVARQGAGGADEAAGNMQRFMASILSPDLQAKAKKGFKLDLRRIINEAQSTGGNPFDAAMQAIIQATAGDQTKIGKLFGDAQAQNFVRPMIQNWDEYIRIRDKALNSSAGTTDSGFAAKIQSDPEKIEGAKIAVDNLSKAFGAALLPAVGETAVKLTELLNGVASFVQENPKLIANTTQVVVGLMGMRTAVLGVRYAWTFLQGPILAVQKAFELFRGGSLLAQMGQFGPTAMRLASGFRVVATAVGAIGGGPIAIAIAAITAGALLVRKYWEPIKAFLGGVWDGLSGAGTTAMGELMRAVEPLRPAWEAVGGLLGQAWDWLSRMLAPAQYTGNELSRVAEIGSLVGTALLANFRLVIQVIGGVVQTIAWLGDMLGIAAGWITVTLGGAWDAIMASAGAAIDWIMGKLQPLLDGISWVSEKVGGGLGFLKDKAVEGAGIAVDRANMGKAVYGSMTANGGGGIGDMARVAYAVGTNDSDVLKRRMADFGSAQQGRQAPSMPSGTPRMPTTVQQQQTNNITIHQQPGESSEALARRTANALQHQQAIQARATLGDRN
ncbi:phage tail tape measure protein [Stenotrophomonas maltophilia]|nr:phage tail tape measure protein [Stenotrophomonas maltophilia]